jgi:DNA-binding GntR family transcriptional regulator
MANSGGPTRAEGVYRRLRADILGGQLVPGQRLKFPELSERYQASVGATREALTRLAADGFVTTRAHQGYLVTPLSHEDLAELTRARVELESLVLRLSVQEGDMRWEADAVAAHHVLDRTPLHDATGNPNPAWSAAHTSFHSALLAGCTNNRLLSTATALRQEAELYVQWSVSSVVEADRDIRAEHRDLLDAATSRDAARAEELLRDHIAHTAQLLISCASDEPNLPGTTTGAR